MRLGLSLAGGGIKGAAHIGVLKALEEENIKIDYISGSSSGSIVATLYAAQYTPEQMLELFKKYSKSIKYMDFRNILKLLKGIIINRKFVIDGLNSGKSIEKIMNKYCKQKGINNISDINIPIIIPSISLYDGKIICFTNKKFRSNFRETYSDEIIYVNDMDIGTAVRASCSFPGVFSPCEYKGLKLIDGGVRENIPWKGLKDLFGADEVLCVVFEKKLKKIPKSVFIGDVISGAFDLLSHELLQCELTGADHTIKIETEHISLLDKSKIDLCYKIGYEAAKKMIKEKFK